MTIPSGLPVTPRWPCGHVRATHAADPLLDAQCRACFLRFSDGPGHDDAFAYDSASGWAEGYYERWDARDAARNKYRGREAEANAWETGAHDTLTMKNRAHVERMERASHRWSALHATGLRTDTVPAVVVPPILHPAYDVDGRPLAAVMNPHIVNHIADLVGGYRTRFSGSFNTVVEARIGPVDFTGVDVRLHPNDVTPDAPS